jgi:hypothetical protein
MLSKSVLILVPQVSVDAPTSGLVSNRFVVVVSAIFYPYAAICQDSLLSAIAVQVSLLSAIASHVSDVSVIGVQVSELSEIASQVSAVSDSGTHFRLPAIVMDDWQVKLMALVCVRVLLTVMADWAAISADARKTTLVATVIVAKSSIRIWTSGTLTPLTDMVLVSTEANAPMATRLAAKLALDVAAKVEDATAYRTAFADMTLALDAVACATATLCAAAVALLDAETENEAVLTTVAETVSVLEAETENAPMQTR